MTITKQWPARFLAPGLLLLTALRLWVAATAPLSPDEAYYWIWSRALSPGYLDHPPMVALWIWLGTALAGETALGVRLLAPIAGALGSLLLVQAGDALFPGRGAGWRAAVMLNATLLFGAGAVTMTPDTPLLFFWTAALWALARIAAGGAGPWWLVVGVASGFALDSKYTAGLVGLGIAGWLLTPGMRDWLRKPWPWVGGALALALFAPVLWWNAAHGWASFAKQGGRTGDWAPGRAGRFLAELVGGQIGLATPILFALFALGVAAAVRQWRVPSRSLLAALVLPGAAVFIEHAVGDRVQANWPSILYPAAALAAAGFGVRWVWPGAGLGFALTLLLYGQATIAPLHLPLGLDPTLRLAGFAALTAEAADFAGRAPFIASEEYGLAALLAWNRPGPPVVASGARWRLFALQAPADPRPGLLILSARRHDGPDTKSWQTAEPLGTLERRRGVMGIEEYRLYRVTLRPGAVAAFMPVPAP